MRTKAISKITACAAVILMALPMLAEPQMPSLSQISSALSSSPRNQASRRVDSLTLLVEEAQLQCNIERPGVSDAENARLNRLQDSIVMNLMSELTDAQLVLQSLTPSSATNGNSPATGIIQALQGRRNANAPTTR